MAHFNSKTVDLSKVKMASKLDQVFENIVTSGKARASGVEPSERIFGPEYDCLTVSDRGTGNVTFEGYNESCIGGCNAACLSLAQVKKLNAFLSRIIKREEAKKKKK